MEVSREKPRLTQVPASKWVNVPVSRALVPAPYISLVVSSKLIVADKTALVFIVNRGNFVLQVQQ